jgi:hypothetical protein
MSNTPAKKDAAVVKVTTAQEMNVNPFAKRSTPGINAGTVAIEESRAVAEAMGKLFVAKNSPRDEAAAFERVMQSCKRKSMAESGEYSYPRGNEQVTGPSIRLAEEMARGWGNIEYGIRELSEDEDSTEMEAYCWDLETNLLTSQKFRVKKERSTRNGKYKLTDQRDIYEQNANLGARRLRARILAVLPPDLVEAAVDQCRQTLKPTTEELPSKVKTLIDFFKKQKVTVEHLEKRLGKKSAEFTPEDVTNLKGIYNSIKDNMSRPGDWFEGFESSDSTPATEGAAGDLNAQIAGQQ